MEITSGGNDTQDKVFLLSYAEANKYFGVPYGNSSNTKSRVAQTAYAIAHGTWASSSNKTADGTDAGVVVAAVAWQRSRTSPRSWTPTVLSATLLSTMSLVLSALLCG